MIESTPLRNPYWQYSRDKIACEDLLTAAYRESDFPVTIVRPSHTYDHTLVPLDGHWTALDRMRRGLPIVVHGDGTSLWTLTHHTDFARAFVGLLANPHALGEAFQITSDEALPWDQIAGLLAEAAGVEPQIVHVTSDAIAAVDPEWGAGLIGDKAHSMIFDNTQDQGGRPGLGGHRPVRHRRPRDRRVARRRPGAAGRRPGAGRHDGPAGRGVLAPCAASDDAELAAAADELYALPAEEFTAARNAEGQAGRKAAGDRDLAAAIQRLARPSAAAALANRLVRRDAPRSSRCSSSAWPCARPQRPSTVPSCAPCPDSSSRSSPRWSGGPARWRRRTA